MYRFFVVVVSCVLIGFSFAAQAKGTDEERMTALEQRMTALQQTRLTNNQEVASSLARFQSLQDEFRGVQGKIEANEHLITSQYQDLSRRIAEIDHRITAIEDRMTIFSTQLSKALGKVAPDAAAEGDLYQSGLDLAAASKYLEAASTFEGFVRKYPKSQFVASSRLWIAECFYSMRDYQRAIKEYQNFIEKYPRDPKIPEAILKQGHSFYELGMLEEAKIFYQKVMSSYPKSAEAAQASERLARIDKRKVGAAATAQSGTMGGYPAETLEQQMSRKAAPAEKPQTPPPDPGQRAPAPARDF